MDKKLALKLVINVFINITNIKKTVIFAKLITNFILSKKRTFVKIKIYISKIIINFLLILKNFTGKCSL